VNIRRIAKLVGTSHMTVSRALNNSPLVAEETRKRVLEVAESLGYQINAGARGLATGLTTTIGILYPYHRLREVESWYTSQLMHDIRSALWKHGFDSMIAGYDTADHNLSDITRLMAQKKVDGLIVIGYEVTAEALEALASITHRYIAVNPPRMPWMNAHTGLFIDQELGGALAAQTLRSAGRIRVAVALEPTPQFETRHTGFIREIGDDVPVFHLPDGTYRAAYDLAVERGTELTRIDGLFGGSDISALGVMNGLLDRGIRVPEEIAIVGFDDIEWARYARPALTTVHQPRREVAAAAAERIMALVQDAGDDPMSTVFQPRVIARESC
jgi:LacI family transcriptional regulator